MWFRFKRSPSIGFASDSMTCHEVPRQRLNVVAVTDAVLARVRRPFPVEPIRTLDAVHLATAELLGEPPRLVTVVTRDARVRDNGRALGYDIDSQTERSAATDSRFHQNRCQASRPEWQITASSSFCIIVSSRLFDAFDVTGLHRFPCLFAARHAVIP
jgi:hypothetical protein